LHAHPSLCLSFALLLLAFVLSKTQKN
jgi:hypothetical protein